MNNSLILVGHGGHARVVLATAQSAAHFGNILVASGELDPGKLWHDCLVAGPDDAITTETATHFHIAFGSTTDPSPRISAFRAYKAKKLTPATLTHSSALCDPSASVGSGTLIAPGVIVNPGCKIGQNVILNTRSLIEHDVTIGNHVHIAPGAILLGKVTIEEAAFVGAGAIIKPEVTIGAGAIVAMGAIVTQNVPPNYLAIGVPAVIQQRNTQQTTQPS